MVAAAQENGVGEARPSIEVTISTGVFSTDNSQRFALQGGGSLRIGRDAENHVTLDLNGVSGTHAELLFQRLDSSEGAPMELCICDHSRNGTAVRPGPQVPGSSWASKIPPAWERLSPGVPRALAHGWQLLAPARSRKGDHQMPFHKRMLTVYTKAPSLPAAAETAAAATVLESASPQSLAAKQAALEEEMAKLRKEKKRKRKDDPAHLERKRAKAEAAATVPAPAAAPAAGIDRRVAQCGAVEEELARRQLVQQQVINQEVARTARPKRKGQPAQAAVAAGADAGDESDHTIVPDDLAGLSDGEGPPISLRSPAQEVADEVDEEAEAASRAVAAAAALRAMKTKKVVATPPKNLRDFAAGAVAGKAKAVQEIDSEAEDTTPKQRASLTAQNLATLASSPGTACIDFDLRSISPISEAGVQVKPKKKEKRRPTSPARKLDSKRDSGKPRLIARSKESPERWNPEAKLAKKRSSRSDDERPSEKIRTRSREKRKHRR